MDKLFETNRIVPVVVINNVDKAIKLAETLLECGINNMEVTLRTPNALDVIRRVSQNISEMCVGAGTILYKEQFSDAVSAGAKFIISPGVTNELLSHAQSNISKVNYIPGICTPSQAMEVSNAGFNRVKFFPAEAYNAYNVIKSLASPLPHIKFCPTGGITVDNMAKYLELANVFAVGLSSIVDTKLIEAGDFAEIRKRCEYAVSVDKQTIIK
ncbi:MAG: bifunctional 4-hydroxy-2-oxoglutarate aldolase/2-dehydro-3-deoxy-phosphogluconate aldolase [Burkholderiales bacterium]|nr:bifunctional 4-hydroxy-2-oxoglutarate aldolase/2-dehydro-3-deoxy-phosphogluconate aldolase [Burkholderiales bacterium]